MAAKYATPVAWTSFFDYDMTVITTVDYANTTFTAAQKDVRNGPCTLWSMLITNMVANPSNPVYVKFFDNISSGLTAGTTAPDMVIPVEDESILHVDFPDGYEFVNGLSLFACATAGDANTTTPAQAVDVVLHTTQGVS